MASLAEQIVLSIQAVVSGQQQVTSLTGSLNGLSQATQTLNGHFLDVNGRLRDAQGRFVAAGSAAGAVAGGANGLLVPALLGGNARAQYFLAFGVLLFTALVSLAVRRSRLHHAFAAIRQGEETARVLGVQVVRYKLVAFFISSFLAALGGVLYAGKTFGSSWIPGS